MKTFIFLVLLFVTSPLSAKDHTMYGKYGEYRGFYRSYGNPATYRFYNKYNSYSGSYQPSGNKYYIYDQWNRQQGNFGFDGTKPLIK